MLMRCEKNIFTSNKLQHFHWLWNIFERRQSSVCLSVITIQLILYDSMYKQDNWFRFSIKAFESDEAFISIGALSVQLTLNSLATFLIHFNVSMSGFLLNFFINWLSPVGLIKHFDPSNNPFILYFELRIWNNSWDLWTKLPFAFCSLDVHCYIYYLADEAQSA